jgi:hypothetical protein
LATKKKEGAVSRQHWVELSYSIFVVRQENPEGKDDLAFLPSPVETPAKRRFYARHWHFFSYGSNFFFIIEE